MTCPMCAHEQSPPAPELTARRVRCTGCRRAFDLRLEPLSADSHEVGLVPRATDPPPKTIDDRSGAGRTRDVLLGRISLSNNKRIQPMLLVVVGLLVFTAFGLYSGFAAFSLLFTLIPAALAGAYIVDTGLTRVEVSIGDGEMRVRRTLGSWVRERRVPVTQIQTVVRKKLGAINDIEAHAVEVAVIEGKSLTIGKGYPKVSLEWLAKHLNDGVNLAQLAAERQPDQTA